MRDALRTCLQIAGGLTEATRRRATATAKELLDQTGIDVDDLQRRIGDRIPPEVQTLADELIASGRANRDLLIGLIREEVDKAMTRVGRLADEVTKVGVVLEALERRVRNLEGDGPAAATGVAEPPVTVEHVPVAVDEPAPAPVPAPAAPAPAKQVTPLRRAAAAPAKKALAEPAEDRAEPVGTAATRGKASPTKETVAKTAPAKTAPAKTAPAKAAPPKRAPAKAAPAKETVAKAAPAKAAPAKETAAKAAPAKTAAEKTSAPATKAAAAKKATPARKSAAAKKATPARKTAGRPPRTAGGGS